MAVDGDPATAWRVADRADPVGEHDPPRRRRADRPPDAAAAAPGRRPCATSGGCRSPSTTAPPIPVDLDDSVARARRAARRHRPDDRAEHRDDHHRQSVVVPDPTIGPALAAVGFAEIDTGLEPTVEVVRPPADAVDAIAAAGEAPVSFVLTRLRTRPSDRWRSDPEPTMVREIELPERPLVRPGDHRAPRPAGRRRRARRSCSAIDGPVATNRLTGVASGGRVGASPTATRRRRGSRRSAAPSASSARRSRTDAAFDDVRARPAERRPLADHRRPCVRRRRHRRVPCRRDSDGTQHRRRCPPPCPPVT